MRKFKGKRRHRNKANAQAQSGPTKTSDAQQPSVSGLGSQAEVDHDGGKETNKVKAESPVANPTDLSVDSEITSTAEDESLKDKGTEKMQDDESSESDGKAENNNNDKNGDELKEFQKEAEDQTLVNGINEDNKELSSLDIETSKKNIDDQKDLFIIEDTDPKGCSDTDENKTDSNKVDIDDTEDKDSNDSILHGSQQINRYADDLSKETLGETLKEIISRTQDGTIETLIQDREASTTDDSNSVHVTETNTDETKTNSHLNEIEKVDSSSPTTTDSSSDEYHEAPDTPDDDKHLTVDHGNCSSDEGVVEDAPHDQELDLVDGPITEAHEDADRSNSDDDSSSGEKEESVGKVDHTEKSPTSEESETSSITVNSLKEPLSENSAEDVSARDSNGNVENTSNVESDDLLITETDNTSSVLKSEMPEKPASEESENGTESDEDKENVDPEKEEERLVLEKHQDAVDGKNVDTEGTSVDIGSSVDSITETSGTDVDNAVDNVKDNAVNQLDMSSDNKTQDMDTEIEQDPSKTPVSHAMCEELADQQPTEGEPHLTLEGEQRQPLHQSLESQEQQLKQQQISHLQQQLREQQEAMTRLQAHAHAQQIQANLMTTSLRSKLRRKEHELKSVTSQHETCISSVISHLLYLEGQMQKEHKQIIGTLREKDDVIRRQKVLLEDLTTKNDRLLMALNERNGYDVTENGVSRPSLPVVTQNGKYSIQDHGNKVVLRGNKVTNKVRFSSMKERLRRHKSSLELYHTEPLETLDEGTLRYFGSQENLVDGDTGYLEGRNKVANRKQRCRSLVEGASDLQEADESHNESPDSCFGEESLSSENISQADSYSLGHSPTNSYTGRSTGNLPSSIGLNELAKSRSVPHALPTVSETDGMVTRSWQAKDRPHSLPSAGLLAGGKAGLSLSTPKVNMTPNVSIPTSSAPYSSSSSSSSSSQPTTTTSSSSSSISESNPFKSFRNVFKRRGSKKKRSVSLGQTSNQQYQDTLKQHFKKYDLT